MLLSTTKVINTRYISTINSDLINSTLKNAFISKSCQSRHKSTSANLKPTQNDDESLRENLNQNENQVAQLFKRKVKDLPKKKQEIPFAKSLFMGKFDTDILTFPELPKDHIDELEAALNYVSVKNDAKSVRESIEKLRMMSYLGFQAPVEFNGQEMCVSEHLRFNEIVSEMPFKYNCLSNEMLGINSLSQFGNEHQKSKYLKSLIDGKKVSAFCGLDCLGSQWKNTTAAIDFEGNYVLNGRKKFVLSANSADFFIVFAEMDDSVQDSLQQIDLTAFIVDKNSPGIIVEKCDTDDDLELSNVHFKDVYVSKDNLLGPVRQGRNILSKVLPQYNLNFGILSLNQHKNILKNLYEYLLKTSKPGEELYKSDMVTSKIGKIICNTYAVESMSYLTSGIMSLYENPDVELESLVVKVLSSELLSESSEICLNLIGIDAIENNNTFNRIRRDAIRQSVLFENQSTLKTVMGLLGVQTAGRDLAEVIKKLRNPLFHGMYVIGKSWASRRQNNDNPKLILGLKNYLHLSLLESANLLEYCVLRLQYATETTLARHGIEIMNKHTDLERLAICLMQIYVMTACVGRASRSYCIGLRHSNIEVALATVICKAGTDVVRENIEKVLVGYYGTADNTYRTLAKNLFDDKQYYLEHPLKRMF